MSAGADTAMSGRIPAVSPSVATTTTASERRSKPGEPSSSKKRPVVRVKKHASTSSAAPAAPKAAEAVVKRPFRSSLASANRPARVADPVPCPQCRVSSAWYLCQHCVQAKLEKHRANMMRLTTARDASRRMTDALLGNDFTEEEDGAIMPDPFGPPSDLPRNPHPIASHHGRAISSRWSQLTGQVADRSADVETSLRDVAMLREKVEAKRAELARRRSYLTAARRMLSAEAEVTQPGGYRRSLEVQIQQLRRRVQLQHEELNRTRKIRQLQLLGYYSVAPPTNSGTHLLARARERFMPGAFEPVGSPPSSLAPTHNSLSSEWTILPSTSPLALPLPTSSDIRRFSRADINTAASLTCQVLQAMAAICGVALPFRMSSDENGRWSFTPDELWAPAGIATTSLKLHLGQSAYAAISGAPATPQSAISTAGRGIEASVMSLGASTLSTLESFVTLPGRNNKTWGRASALQAHGNPGKEAAVATDAQSGAATSRKVDTALASARDFCRALVMLAYNAAYFAWSQGVQIDLVKAGGSTLRLLYEAAHAVGTKRSHLAVPPSSTALHDFTFPTLDFSKLLQLHELHDGTATPPGGTGGTPSSPSSSSSASRRSASATIASRPLMEESYVDAGQVAASLLNLDAQPVERKESRSGAARSKGGQASTSIASPSSNTTPLRSSGAPADRRTTAASKAGSTMTTTGTTMNHVASSPVSLDFLRQRGQKEAARASGSGSTSGTGAVRSSIATGTPSTSTSRPRVDSAGQRDLPLGAGVGAGAGAGGNEKLRDGSAESRNRSSQSRAIDSGRSKVSSSSSSARKGDNASTPSRASGSDLVPASASAPASVPASAGTVIFNGKEIGSSRSGRRKGKDQTQVQTTEGRTSSMRTALGRTGIEAGRERGSADGARYASSSSTPRRTTVTATATTAAAAVPASAEGSMEDKGKGKSVQSDEADEWDVV
ncbi:hypothetical protein BCV69DRAFT_279981 [Microstroma glucosiphilum]|uniref:Autophagy-related protein 14 n=1 Tax=Pseudomicrostroma glucosiphilum TaxID=1684307 RepID=A0A316UIB9_9BASI|nr:hypothetical protein BCV69DRAFT_279981 [Pseudomicrostroma glucosiphilum]PWN24081.1 hypothetical protein BCV69DRAFT_279981 [Pseudomicrostroma glucosiphilum]